MVKFNVFGNHTIFRYVRKFNLTEQQKDELVAELKEYGYEIEVSIVQPKIHSCANVIDDDVQNKLIDAMNDYAEQSFSSATYSTNSNNKKESLIKDVLEKAIEEIDKKAVLEKAIEEIDKFDYWNKIAKENGFDLNKGDKILISQSLAENKCLREGVVISPFVKHDEVIFVKNNVFNTTFGLRGWYNEIT